MLQAGSSEWRVALVMLLAIVLAGVIVVAVAGGWSLSQAEEEVLWGYVEANNPKETLA